MAGDDDMNLFPCEYTLGWSHSADSVSVHCGRGRPVILCGYHASPQWITTALSGVPHRAQEGAGHEG